MRKKILFVDFSIQGALADHPTDDQDNPDDNEERLKSKRKQIVRVNQILAQIEQDMATLTSKKLSTNYKMSRKICQMILQEVQYSEDQIKSLTEITRKPKPDKY